MAGLVGTSVTGCGGARRAGSGGPEEEAATSSEQPAAPLTVFAGKAFYRERSEPEERLRGVLRRVPVRTGPDTRDMPLRLTTDAGEKLAVYVSGFDLAALGPFVDRRVEIVGKRIDQRAEGYDVEVWIGTIALEGR